MVKLPGGFSLRAANGCLTLYQTRTAQDKKTNEPKEVEDVAGYYNTLPGALQGWYRGMTWEIVAKDEEIELKELLAAMRALSDEVERTVGGMTYAGGRLSP